MGSNFTTVQHSLNAGETSERYDARQDKNGRLAACALLKNWRPLTLGGVTRRPGMRYVATCKVVADRPLKRIIGFRAANDAAYIIELGHLYARFYRNGLPIYTSGTTPLEIVTPWADTDLAALHPGPQSVDVLYLLHQSYPVQKISRTGPITFTITAVNFDPPALLEEEPTGDDLGIGTLTPGATTGAGITFEAQNAGFLAADVGRLVIAGGGRGVIASVVDPDTITVDIIDAFADTSAIPADEWRLRLSPQTTLDIENDKKDVGVVTTLTFGATALRAVDVGKWIPAFGGSIRIDQVTGGGVSGVGTIKSELKDITGPNPDATRAWTLEVPAWSGTLGFPSSGTFFQERLFLCKGLTVNGSVTNDFENFAKGSGADDAIARTISDDDIDPIVWIKGIRTLQIGTGSGAFEVTPTSEGSALTPTSFKIDPISSRGAARIPPIRVGGVIIYVQWGQRKIRELVFDFATDKFKSPNLFQLAEHLADGFFITEVCYAQEPDSVIFSIRNDGMLLALTYQEDEQVIGWSHDITDGEFVSQCAIPRPSTGKDWHWFIVERDNGAFIEYSEPDGEETGREWRDLQTDSAVLVTHDASFVVTILDGSGNISHHLDGKICRVIGDGMLFNDALVTDAEFILSPQVPVAHIEVGLDFESDGLSLEPVIPAEFGGPFIARGYSEVGVRIRRTLGLTLNGEQLTYRKPIHPMGQQVPLQKGKKCITNLGYDPFSRISFKQTLPFPAEVLNIVGRLHIGDRWDCGTEDQSEQFFTPITTNALGFVSKECGLICQKGQYAQATYNGSTEPAGPAIRITAQSGRFLFHGLVAVYVPNQNLIALVLIDGHSLATFNDDDIEVSVAATLNVGDVLSIEADLTDEELYLVKVNDSTVISHAITQAELSVFNSCVGFVRFNSVTEDVGPPSAFGDGGLFGDGEFFGGSEL